MFLGHFGLAFALKRLEPKVSLGTLFAATQMVDILWAAFLLFGWERVRILPDDNPLLTLQFYDYPITHSFAGALGWGVVAAALYYSWPTRDTTRHWQAAVLAGGAAASHWVLDVIVHLRDLPLAGNDSAKFGLGLWRNLGASVSLELLVLGVGVWLYVTSRSRKHPLRPVRVGIVVLILIAAYAASIVGPPPPSTRAIGVSALVFLLFIAVLAAWADRPSVRGEPVAATHPAR